MIVDHLPDYNNAPLIEQIEPADQTTLARLGLAAPVIIKYGLEQDVGAAIIHRHFSVDNGCGVVWKIINDRLVADVEEIDPVNNMAISWRIDEGTILVPFEYVALNTLPGSLRIKIAQLSRSEGVHALATTMSVLSVQNRFVISLLPAVISSFKQTVSPEALEHVGYETSHLENRRSELTFPALLPPDAGPSLWIFQPGGRLKVASGCTGGGCNTSPPPPSPP